MSDRQTKHSNHNAIKLEISNEKIIFLNLIHLEIIKHFCYDWVKWKKIIVEEKILRTK